MKHFLTDNTVTYNLMSFTGFKALVMFSLLIESPKSYDEIQKYLSKYEFLPDTISVDTMRVYITSLKRIGCTIKREKINNISKYSIVSHPFELNFSNEQIQSVLKVYKNIIKNISVTELVQLENFFEKLTKYINNKNFKELFLKASVLKDIDKNIINDLIECCDKKEQITVLYNSPNSGHKTIDILTDKLEYNNGKIYLYGTGLEYMEYASFLVSRILKIKKVQPFKTVPVNLKEITVGIELKLNSPDLTFTDIEKVIQKNKNKLIVELKSSNEFLIRQRLLYYGPNCKILYPDSYRKEFVAKLEQMKAGYLND